MLMMNEKRLGAVALAFVMMAVIAVPAFAASDEVTVGRFVQEMAKAKRLNATDAVTARNSLRAAGIIVPDISFSKRLTELDVTLFSRTAGLQVTTSNPDGYFNQDQVDRFFASFASEIGVPNGAGAGGGSTDEWCQNPNGCDNPGEGTGPGNGNGGPPFDPFTKGKGKNKGKGKSSRTPTDPE
jgi:hypothetical protein